MTGSSKASPRLVLVAALARNRVIGSAGGLPWRLPADMRRFKAITMGRPMIMGRRTYESIGRPLPGRRIIVVTRDSAWSADGAETAGSLDEAIAMALNGVAGEAVVAGGGEIYAEALARADAMRLTWVEAEPHGDTWFPQFDPADWHETAREPHPAEDGRPAFCFVDYERARAPERVRDLRDQAALSVASAGSRNT